MTAPIGENVMVMFDNLICEMPIPGEPKPKELIFQTKDLDCQLDSYRINAEGRLLVQERWDKPIKQVDFHGLLNFYTFEGASSDKGYSGWFKYSAKFTNGICQKIDVIEISLTHFEKKEKTVLIKE
jgi:hypothetical protein